MVAREGHVNREPSMIAACHASSYMYIHVGHV